MSEGMLAAAEDLGEQSKSKPEDERELKNESQSLPTKPPKPKRGPISRRRSPDFDAHRP